ncbi:MAG: trypsin-like serine protease [Phycisphaerales bacterium]|jgi:hypothetical protein|nr:trypsin-like serine protease [Phycisphaerales bacterium]MBT7170861.1 trypsin-like serine protease [Phycisphaerales bacterium]
MKFKSLLILLLAVATVVMPLDAASKKPKKAPAAKSKSKASARNFHYVGQWRGYKKGKSGFGLGTVSMIAPGWAITAKHVASNEIRSPKSVNAQVEFSVPGSGRTRKLTARVAKAYGSFKGDFALLRLDKPLNIVPKVALLADPITKKDGTITFTMIGHKGGLHVHRGRKGRSNDGQGFYHSKTNGGRPGKAGDSGGAWVIERSGKERDVQFSVIHGGGKGPQVAPNRKAINAIIARETPKVKVQWVSKKDLPQLKGKAPAKKAPAKKKKK